MKMNYKLQDFTFVIANPFVVVIRACVSEYQRTEKSWLEYTLRHSHFTKDIKCTYFRVGITVQIRLELGLGLESAVTLRVVLLPKS